MKLIKKICFAVMLISAPSINVYADTSNGKYGFASNFVGSAICEMWNYPFPVTLKLPDLLRESNVPIDLFEYNIIWVSDHGKGMGYYYDYFSNGETHSYWPQERSWGSETYADINIGNAENIACTTDTACTQGEKVAVNGGMSKYNELVAEFGKENIRAAHVNARGDGTQYNQMLDGRSFKLLRIEIFTPAGNYTKKGNYEPFYLEYRRKAGTNNEMELVEKGGYTFSLSTKNDLSNLDKVINLNKLSAIQIFFDWIPNIDAPSLRPTESIYVTAETDKVTEDILQKSPIPKICE
ncbi:hypothetical protein [Pseudocitrobacter faecalis]|uniref:Uncharacterized protein n=1 Tax=Pseudocitrobacter faecalis TaxID=1398493 RepID=A0ABX9FQW2_9ENTR|nr:hypothetical protein DFQ50_109108 [Pseudocitrobacter faecalis]